MLKVKNAKELTKLIFMKIHTVVPTLTGFLRHQVANFLMTRKVKDKTFQNLVAQKASSCIITLTPLA